MRWCNRGISNDVNTDRAKILHQETRGDALTLFPRLSPISRQIFNYRSRRLGGSYGMPNPYRKFSLCVQLFRQALASCFINPVILSSTNGIRSHWRRQKNFPVALYPEVAQEQSDESKQHTSE